MKELDDEKSKEIEDLNNQIDDIEKEIEDKKNDHDNIYDECEEEKEQIRQKGSEMGDMEDDEEEKKK